MTGVEALVALGLAGCAFVLLALVRDLADPEKWSVTWNTTPVTYTSPYQDTASTTPRDD